MEIKTDRTNRTNRWTAPRQTERQDGQTDSRTERQTERKRTESDRTARKAPNREKKTEVSVRPMFGVQRRTRRKH